MGVTLVIIIVLGAAALAACQQLASECEVAPYWTAEGRRVMEEYRGNVTLVALMELHCSFCRSQIEGFVTLSKMMKNQSVSHVQIVIIAPWNESAQYVSYYKRYLEPHAVKVFQETATEPIWSTLKGNKDDFYVYDACGRLSYFIPYPQSYLYYHYTISTLYSTLRQEKCGPCRFITALKIRAYMNVMRGDNTTTHYHYGGPVTSRPSTTTMTSITSTTTSTTSTSALPRTTVRTRTTNRRGRGRKTTSTTPSTTSTTATLDSQPGAVPDLPPTPVLVSVVSREEDVDGNEEVKLDNGRKQVVSNTAPSTIGIDQITAQIPAVTAGTSATENNQGTTESEYEEYDVHGARGQNTRGNGAGGSIDSSAIGNRSKTSIKRLNATTSAAITTSVTAATSTGPIHPGTDGKENATTPANSGPPGQGATRVPKLADGVDCTSYTAAMCYNQWQEFGTLHSCCQRGVYLTDACKAPLCTNATYQLCCFQKYQQARFQCCYDDQLSTDQPDAFSRCCYEHFVFDDDGNGDGDDQCCPRSVASYFWSTQTRVSELCLPNVELDLEGIVLEARMSDKSMVKIPLQQSSALRYECPYIEKRTDFYYWEPDSPADLTKSAKLAVDDMV